MAHLETGQYKTVQCFTGAMQKKTNKKKNEKNKKQWAGAPRHKNETELASEGSTGSLIFDAFR